MANPIASLQVLLEAQTAQFQAGMSQAQASMLRMNNSMRAVQAPMQQANKSFLALGNSVKLLAGSFVVLQGFQSAVQGLTQADDVVDTARAYGTYSTNILALQKALMSAGGSGDEFSGMLGRLTAKVDDALQGNEKAISTFERIGVSLEALRKMPIDKQFEAISEALKNTNSRTEAVAVSMDIFGRKLTGIDWKSFNSSIKEHNLRMTELKEAANAAGGDIRNLTEEQQKFIKAWEGYEYAATAMDRFRLSVKELSNVLISKLGWGLAYTEAGFAGLASLLESVGITTLFRKIGEAAEELLSPLDKLQEWSSNSTNVFKNLFPEATTKAAKAASDVMAGYAEQVRKANQEIANQEGAITSVGHAMKSAGDVMMDSFAKGLRDALLSTSLLPQQIQHIKNEIEFLGNSSDLSAQQLAKLKVLQEELAKLESRGTGADPMKKWADSIYESQKAFDLVPQQMEQLKEMFKLGMIDIVVYEQAMANLQATLGKGVGFYAELQTALAGFGQQFSSTFIDNVLEGKATFENFMSDLTRMILKFMFNQQVQKFLTMGFGGMGTPAGSGIGNWFASLFMANGGAFKDGVQFFANGGVVNSPTGFGMKGGMGIMGEAGPEAIMPLRRSGDGKLGVGASPVNIEIINQAGVEVSASSTDNEDGSRNIQVMIVKQMKDAFGNGTMDKTMRSAYGLNRSPA